jgi:hypothetical protein
MDTARRSRGDADLAASLRDPHARDLDRLGPGHGEAAGSTELG